MDGWRSSAIELARCTAAGLSLEYAFFSVGPGDVLRGNGPELTGFSRGEKGQPDDCFRGEEPEDGERAAGRMDDSIDGDEERLVGRAILVRFGVETMRRISAISVGESRDGCL
jgi:hypothetical protein